MEENKKYDELYKAVLKLKTIEDCEDFFSDLCTYKELDAMKARLEAAKLLIEGETYESIIKTVEISSATLSRVSRCVQHGKGYKKIIGK